MEKTSILITDDNISLARSLCFILGRKGYETVMAKNGIEAVKNFRDKFFDIIFMDIKMPLMNGVEAFRKIKKIRPGTLVFMMTAYAVESLVEDALEVGASGILYKPLDLEKLLNIVGNVKNE